MKRRNDWEMMKMNGKIVIAISTFAALVLLLFIACSATDLPVMQPRLENASVYPEESRTGNQTFNYTVYCTFSKKVNITLEVYNLSLHDWISAGDKTYNNTGKQQMLNWSSKICSGKCEGTSSYRFKYNETILLNKPGQTITPPSITILKEFKNGTVKPAFGYYNYSFNYSVYVNLNETVNITLEIFDISSYKWNITENNQTYNETGKWQLLTWNNVSDVFDKDCAGLASYRFYYSADGERPGSEIFYGPELESWNETKIIEKYYYGGGGGGGGGHVSKSRLKKMVKEILEEEQLEEWKREIGRSEHPNKPKITCNVTPEVGRWFKTFKYNATIKHPDRVNMTLALYVYKPGIDDFRLVKWRDYKSNVVIRNNSYNDKNITYVEWESKEIFDEKDVNKNGSYLFSIDAGLEDDLNKNIVSERLENEFNTKGFSLSKDAIVTKKREDKWMITDKGEEEAYIVRKEDEKLNIYNSSDYIYYIWYYDGCYEYDLEKEGYFIDEPENVTENHEPIINVKPLVRDSGSTHDTYSYEVEIYDPDISDTVFISLYVKDPLDKTFTFKRKVEVKGGNETITFAISPDDGVFTLEKLKKYCNETGNKTFNSSYRFEYWDEGMEAAGKSNRTNWFRGPNIIPVMTNVTLEVFRPKGKYTDEFTYIVRLRSSMENIISIELKVYDSSNRLLSRNSSDIPIPANIIKNISLSKCSFSFNDVGKKSRCKISWNGKHGHKGEKELEEPEIVKAVPTAFPIVRDSRLLILLCFLPFFALWLIYIPIKILIWRIGGR